MKLLSIAVPCYNSAEYMEHAVNTLLAGGEDVEILVVDDGSQKDNTLEIAQRLQAEHPTIVKAIHQENAGHGGAVMTGLRNATGMYFKVVDSDDWVDETILRRILVKLREFSMMEKPVDLLVSNYVYDKVGVKTKRVIHYRSAMKADRLLTWDDVGAFATGHYLLMHALIYRTEMLRNSGLELPKHTFYVDNLYATVPLASVESLYYMDVNFYHYFIGREDQSVQTNTMIKRIDQQLRVNKLLFEQVDVEHVANKRQQQTIFNYQEIITVVSSIMCILGDTDELTAKKDELWQWLKENHPWEYNKIRKGFFGRALHIPGKPGRFICAAGYKLANKLFNFN
ncbi:MAG: glycosyltransferase family 2 protein [Oscillospiraceae bacterium]|nr:glycosyltransferase family 2 protein [Oscillospiraceae bacterium]